MSMERDLASVGERWSGWAKIVAAVVGLGAVLGVGTWFYNDVWRRKALVYTVLPGYDLGGQFFTGLVIENRGRVPLTDIQIVLSDIGAPIDRLHMPGVHEPVWLVSGGEGEEQAYIEMGRLSRGASLSIYLILREEVVLEEGVNFCVNSSEVAGIGEEGVAVGEVVGGVTALMIAVAAAVMWIRGLVELVMLAGRKESC